MAKSLYTLTRSGIRMIYDLAAEKKDVAHMEIGDPSFDTPSHIKHAAMEAINGNITHYTTHNGMASLREAVLNKVISENGIQAKFEQIGITPGAGFGVAAAIMTAADPGDEILLPDPGYPIYHNQAVVNEIQPVYYPLNFGSGYQPDIEGMEARITPRTKALIINSPGNPTGAVFSEESIRGCLELCRRHRMYLISDEVYEKIIFSGRHISPGAMDDEGLVITIFSTSKTYAMTGWRIGYFVAPEKVAKAMGRATETFVACSSSISQKAAEAALRGPQDCVTKMCETYRELKEICEKSLKKAELKYSPPQGAFYITVDISESGLKSYDFSRRILEEAGVAVAPGLTFGPGSDHIVRLSFCSSKDKVANGIDRFCAFLKKS